MMNKKRKGFTIVELVIVIAVIAVLAAVLIPTFSSVIDKANESAALQEVQNAYINALADALGKDLENQTVTTDSGFTFKFIDSTGQNATISGPDDFNYSARVENGVVVLGEAGTGGTGGSGESGESGEGGGNEGAGGSEGTGEDEEDDGIPVLTSENLADAFANGGEYKLPEGGLTISSALELPTNTSLSIDLNGQTLTIEDVSDAEACAYSLTILGSLTVTDNSADKDGAIELASEKELNDWCWYYAGISVGDPTGQTAGGTLDISGVNIVCNRYCNIENYGTATITNSTVTVNGGHGFCNEGTVTLTNTNFAVNYDDTFVKGEYAFENLSGTATITGGSFVAKGKECTSLYAEDGIVNVNGTEFSEGTGFEGYAFDAPIVSYSNGQINLDQVTFTEGAEKYSVYATNSGTVNITSGTYNIVACVNGASIIIENGTFNGLLSCAGNTSSIILKDGKFYNGTNDYVNHDKIGDTIYDSTGRSTIHSGDRVFLEKATDDNGDVYWIVKYSTEIQA